MKTIAEEYKDCTDDMSEKFKQDLEAFFFCGVLLGLGYMADGISNEQGNVLADEIDKKLEIT